MKFILETDNETTFRRHMVGPRALDVLLGLDNYLRDLYKYQDRSEEVNKFIEHLRDELRELCDDEGILNDVLLM